MKKKMYSTPAVEVIELENEALLLAGSEGGRPGVSGTGGSSQSLPDSPDSKPVFSGAFGSDDE